MRVADPASFVRAQQYEGCAAERAPSVTSLAYAVTAMKGTLFLDKSQAPTGERLQRRWEG